MATCNKRAREEYNDNRATLPDAAALHLAAEVHAIVQHAAATLSTTSFPEMSALSGAHNTPAFQTGAGIDAHSVPMAAERSVLSRVEALLSKMDSALATEARAKK